MEYVWPLLGVALVLVLTALVWQRRRAAGRPARARALFPAQRPALEEAFFRAAADSGKPRGLRWVKCEFGDGLELARDRNTGEILGLLPVTVSFEAIPGSDMEGLPAVGNLRYATAVFTFRGGAWTTVGRTVFNMNPEETLRHFEKMYDRIE